MNNENLEFLQNSLKYLGFGEKLLLNRHLEEFITSEAKEFQLESQAFYDDETKLEVILHFRRSDQSDMYFFSKYLAKLHRPDDPSKDREQLFYISKGAGMTLKEAYNLLQGRSVNKDLTDADAQKYNAWVLLNFEEKDKNDHYKVKKFGPHYGFDLEKTLERYPILELKNEALKIGLLRSLKRGNLHTVTFQKSNKTEKMVIEANPQYKTLNIYSLSNRVTEKTSLKQDHAGTAISRPVMSGKNEMDAMEEETDREETEEGKEGELELPGGKPSAKKRSYRQG